MFSGVGRLMSPEVKRVDLVPFRRPGRRFGPHGECGFSTQPGDTVGFLHLHTSIHSHGIFFQYTLIFHYQPCYHGAMATAEFRFFEELNDFLPPGRRKVWFPESFFPGESVKSVIENLGVPHTEVDLVTVNSESVSFSHILQENDRVCVYPVFESFDIAPVSKVRPEPLRSVRFLLDVHLGKLAGMLRMLGFDACCEEPFDDPSLAARSRREQRILLTRDRGLLKRTVVTHGCCVRSSDPMIQTAEVVRRFDLRDRIRPFTRCMACNGLLVGIDPGEAAGRVPEGVMERHREFKCCESCGRLYWKGTHWEHMRAKLASLIGQQEAS